MKKLFLYFSFARRSSFLLAAAGLFIFHSSFAQTHDTLFYKDGFKRAVQIIEVGREISYKVPPSDTIWTVERSRINYIKYENGVYSVDQPKTYDNTTPWGHEFLKQMHPYILISVGASYPFPYGYGDNSFANQNDAGNWSFNDVGYATGGSIYSVTTGLILYKGWEITGEFSRIQNGIDANGYINKPASLFLGTRNGWAGASDPVFMPITNVNVIGSYKYNNYALLFGIGKNWESRRFGFGFSIMIGSFITQIPAMHGIATYNTYQYGTITSTTYYFLNTNSPSQKNFDFQLGMHLDIKITHHIFLRGLMEFQNSNYGTGGDYELTDMNNGSIFKSGEYYGNSLVIAIFNFTAGLGYKF